MKKFRNLKIGGLQFKILRMVIVFIIILVVGGLGIAAVKSLWLNNIINSAMDKQQQAVEEISNNAMSVTIQRSLEASNVLRSNVADSNFSEVISDVRILQEVAQKLFEQADTLTPAAFALPDPDTDGIVMTHVLYEEGVDYQNSEYLPIAAHMSDLLMAMLTQSDKVSCCYIGLADGTHLGADTMHSDNYDENGSLIYFPVRQRPWYRGAVEKGDLYLSGIEKDHFSGGYFMCCSAPVIVDGEVKGVVAMDIVFENTFDFLGDFDGANSFCLVINDEGKVVIASEDNGFFSAELTETAEDLRQSDNAELAALVTEGISRQTDVRIIRIGGTEYCMTASPIESVGWTVVGAVKKELIEQPTVQMLSEIDEINDETSRLFSNSSGRALQMTIVFVVHVIILANVVALFRAGKIVKPLESMTGDIIQGGQTGKLFEMKEIYRTGDEIEVLAESFDDLSRKTRQYIQDITRITREKERINTELELARKIQSDMLPRAYPAFPDRPEFDIYATMDPAKEVGGDFYDYFLIDKDHLGIVMADVSGKGVPAALFMMMSRIILSNCAMMGSSPADVLEQVNGLICKNNVEDMFVTVWFGVLDIRTGKVTAANAGHECPIVRRSNGRFELIRDPHGFVLGGIESVKYREYSLQLEKGSTLFLYTDGVPEATNTGNEMFTTRKLLETMNRHNDSDPVSLLTDVTKAVDEFVGEAEQFDDITMLALTYLGPGKEA